MNSVGKLGLGVLALGAVGVGGFFVLDQQVHNTIEQSFANISTTTPLIRSASYDSYRVDYMANTLTFQEARFDFSIDELMKLQNVPEDLTYEGTFSQNHNTIKVTGLWDLILGGQVIQTLLLSKGEFRADMNMSTSVPVGKGGTDKNTLSFSQHFVLNGAFGDISINDLVWQDQSIGSPSNPLGVTLASLSADDLDFDVEVTVDKPQKVMPDAQTENVSPEQLFIKSNVKIDRVSAMGIRPDSIDTLRYEDIALSVDLPTPFNKAFNATIATFGIDDLKYVGVTPVKMSYFIDDFALPPEIVSEPQIKGLLAAFGIEELSFDFKVGYDYNLDDRTLSMNPISFGAKNAGTIDLAFGLQGVPGLEFLEQVQELTSLRNGATAEALAEIDAKAQTMLDHLLDTLSISHVSLGYADLGILKKFLTMQALKAKTDMAGIAQVLSNQGAMIVIMTHGEGVAQDAQKKFAAFLENPDAIQIKLSVDTPVKIEHLIKDFELVGPQAFRQFGLDITSGTEAQSH